jgi:hypothetical protein
MNAPFKTFSTRPLSRFRAGRRITQLVIVLQASALASYGQVEAIAPQVSPPTAASPWFTGYTLGGGAFATSIDDGWAAGLTGSAGLLIKESSLFYVNVAGSRGESRYYDDSEISLFNVGGGYRYGFANGRTSVGINSFYDELKIDSTGATSSQQSFGIDAIHGRWFVNANWYEPLSGDTLEIRKSPTQIRETRQSQFSGWDAEIGASLFTEPERPINVIVALGYYDFSNAFSSVSGLRARTDVTFWDHFSLGAEWRQNGAQMGQEWRFTASVRFATGRRFAQPIDIPAAAPLPPVELAYAASGKSVVGDFVSYSSGKYAKNVLPILPPAPEDLPPPSEALNVEDRPLNSSYAPLAHGMNHLNPRVFWPTRSTQVRIRNLPPPTRPGLTRSNPGPPCSRCTSGPPLRFD